MLLELVNVANPSLETALTVDDMLIGDPVSISNTLTRVLVTPRFSSIYFKNREITYDRINLNVLMRNTDVRVIKSLRIPVGPAGIKVTTVHGLLDDLNLAYGLSLTVDDIEDIDITKPASHNPTTGKYESGVVVNAKSTSLGFIGSFKFIWEMGGSKPHISQFFTDTRLRGFV